uniref:Uncharacterized protein n=1 Tax=Anguilla anguilla TaxID=7936 RepID=A0A0E9RCJ3_ANGAN
MFVSAHISSNDLVFWKCSVIKPFFQFCCNS